MMAREGLKGTDLITAFIKRRVLPLQRWAHIIGLMGDRRDPTRMSSEGLSLEQVTDRVNDILQAGMVGDWHSGKAP